jgi:hypothetical protein
VRIFVEKVFKMQHLEVSCAVRPIYGSLGAKGLITTEDSDVCARFSSLCFGRQELQQTLYLGAMEESVLHSNALIHTCATVMQVL